MLPRRRNLKGGTDSLGREPLTLILADSSIELVPDQIQKHPAIRAWAKRKGKSSEKLVLDRNYHHAALRGFKDHGFGRGRPDIAHLCLLLALGSPLSEQEMLKCYVHTVGNEIIDVNPKVRLPRQSDRWIGLLEQLFAEKQVPKNGEALLSLSEGSVQGVLNHVKSDNVIALSAEGKTESLENIAHQLAKSKRPVLIIGGFSEGHFSKSTLQTTGQLYSIHSKGLEASTVVARALYDFERALETRHD